MMYLLRSAIGIIFLCSTLSAYVDNDIDGVDDAVDACLNTPFDELVDERGCSYDKNYRGELTLKLGSDVSFDTISEKTTNINIFANYRYNSWDISLSNASYSTNDSFNSASSAAGDLYIRTGYLFTEENFNTKLMLGVKVATADAGIGTGENDYFSSLDFDYFINEEQDLFFYLSYTISGDSRDIDYADYISYTIGSGYMINDRWYSAFSYDYSGTQYPGSEAYLALSWFNSYEFSERFFATFNYTYGLDDISYDHTLSLKFGVHFE